jgi:hypothetical protein
MIGNGCRHLPQRPLENTVERAASNARPRCQTGWVDLPTGVGRPSRLPLGLCID